MRACKVVFRRGFHRNVDRREALLLVCSSIGIEVVENLAGDHSNNALWFL